MAHSEDDETDSVADEKSSIMDVSFPVSDAAVEKSFGWLYW